MSGSSFSLGPQSVLSASRLRHASEAKDHFLEVLGLLGKAMTMPDTLYSPTAEFAQIRAFADEWSTSYARFMSENRPVHFDDEELDHTSIDPYTIAIVAACAYRCLYQTSKG